MSNVSKKHGEMSFLKAAFIQAVSKYSTVIMQMAITVVLARLLTPEQYGVMAGVTVFTSFFSILADLGLGPAIIQYQNLDSRDYGSIFIFSCGLGLCLSCVFIFLGTPLSFFFHDSTYTSLCAWVSVSVFFNTVNMVPNGLLLKGKKFKLIGVRLFITTIVGGLVAIVLAYVGLGVFALVANINITAILVFLWNYLSIKKELSFTDLHIVSSMKVIAKYSLFQAGANFVNYFARNLDHLVIGRAFNSVSLGLYDKAYKLTAYPITFVPQVLASVIQPFLAKYQNDKYRLRDFYHKVTFVLAIVGAYVTFLFVLCSNEIVTIFYGDNWKNCIPLFAILSCSLFCQLLGNITGPMLQSAGRTDLLLRQTSIATVIIVVSMLLGASTGNLTNLAIGVALGYCLQIFTCVYYVEKIALEGQIRDYCKEVVTPLMCGLVAFVPCMLCKRNFLSSLNTWISLLICTFSFTGLFVLVVALTGGFKKCLNILRR